MSLRLRWTFALVLAALLLLGGISWFLDASIRGQRQRSARAWALRQESELRSSLASFGDFAVAGVEELRNSPALRDLLVLALREGRAGYREVIGWGEQRAARYGLDALMVLREDGTVLTHAVWPAKYGLVEDSFETLRQGREHPAMVWESEPLRPEESARWYLGACRSLDFDSETIYVVGGRELGSRAMGELRDRSEVAELELGLELPGWRLAPMPAEWWMAQQLPLVYRPAPDPSAAVLGAMRGRLLLLASLSLALVVVLSPWLARGLVQPLARLQGAVRELEGGSRELRIPEQGPAEVREIGRALEQLAESLQASEARARAAQRRAAWREMARRVAHELKNALSPLTLAVDNVETAVERNDEAARRALRSSLGTARDQLGSLDRLVSEFRDFARTPGLHFGDAVAEELAEAALAAAREVHPEVRFERVLEGEVGRVRIDAEQLRRALHNLLINAAEAAPGAPVELALGRRKGQDRWWFAVRDRGPGLPEEVAERWGEPYHTSKPDGTGLGVTIAMQVIEGHGGRLEPRPRPGGGLEIVATLPRRPRPPEEEQEA